MNPYKAKNFKMANKGQAFEEEVNRANFAYLRKGIALVQKISTPWKVVRRGENIVSAYPEGKSTLDFRGTIRGGVSISFDCKESQDEKGLPLSHIQEHQIQYIEEALKMGEVSFILCLMKIYNKRYLIPGQVILDYWNIWKKNKGKKGFNYIAREDMIEIVSRDGVMIDYIRGLEQVMK